MQQQWLQLRDAWILAKTELSKSPHTERNYRRSWQRWADWVARQHNNDGRPLKLWQVEPRHVREWQRHLREAGREDGRSEQRGKGLSEVTINNYLAIVSSFYNFVIDEKVLVQGCQRSLFLDTNGAQRANPFRHTTVTRPKIGHYEKANPLSKPDLAKLFRSLEKRQDTPIGARNYALLLLLLLTGWRSREVLRMQWKHLRPSRSQRGIMIYAWTGKQGRQKDEPVPPDAWNAIVHYLRIDERWLPGAEPADQPLDPDEYIFKAACNTKWGNLPNLAKTPDLRTDNEPLSDQSLRRVVRLLLRNAGIQQPERYRLPDIRHTFGQMLIENGYDLKRIQELMHHRSRAVTELYTREFLRKMEDPIDSHSTQLYRQYRSSGANSNE